MSDATAVPVSTPAATERPIGRAHAAIARAAERTGTDFSYLLAQARLESSLDPAARARTSSAAGLFQFIDSTWLETLDRHAEAFGMAGVGEAIDRSGGRARVTDPSLRGAIMGLRFDADASALMAGALAQDNRAALAPVLGRDPDASELYLAHFLGAAGASRFLSALAANPAAPAAAMLPEAASANRAIFYEPGGSARSLSQVMELVRGKMARAMNDVGEPGGIRTGSGGFQVAQAAWRSAGRSVAPQPSGELAAGRSVPSMAETLRDSFALSDQAGRPGAAAHVQAAYGKLRALGL